MKKNNILIINGPNLNLLGNREPNIYGKQSLRDINNHILEISKTNNMNSFFYQSNIEGNIVAKIQESKDIINFIIINPAAYTHTSVAIRDAFLAINIPFIEIHLSNPHKRESFRHKSYLSDIAYGVILGMGTKSYELAMVAAIDYCKDI